MGYCGTPDIPVAAAMLALCVLVGYNLYHTFYDVDASHSIRATFQRGTEIPDFGPVVGEVYISIENNTYWGGDFTGTLASGWYDLCAEDTMMTIVLKALALDGYSWWGTGASDTGGYDITYLSGIYMDKNGNGRRDNSEPSLAEFDGSRGAGWMGTLNDWFTSEGFAAYTVANGKLKAGDEIAVQHTCNLGADIGGAFGDSNKTLKAIALSAGELNPAFSSGVHDYTMILPEGVTALTVTPTASNKQNRVRIYVGGTEYGRKDAIPVQVGTVITLKVGNDGDATPETYTIALQAAGNLLSGGNVSLTSIHQDGSAGTKVALTFDKETAAFTGKLANYTHLKQYRAGGFTATPSDLPAGATAVRTAEVRRQVTDWFLTKEKANTDVIFTVDGFSFSGSGQKNDSVSWLANQMVYSRCDRKKAPTAYITRWRGSRVRASPSSEAHRPASTR